MSPASYLTAPPRVAIARIASARALVGLDRDRRLRGRARGGGRLRGRRLWPHQAAARQRGGDRGPSGGGRRKERGARAPPCPRGRAGRGRAAPLRPAERLARAALSAFVGARGRAQGGWAPARRVSAPVTCVAVVDLGTNSTRLLVADVEDGIVREVNRRLEITRLGEDVDARRLLLPSAIARVRNVLADYRRAVEELGAERTLVFATSAVRDAENGEAFLGEI